ncbi:MAG TPA: PIG-L family deacetylase [Rhizomicrobium sp.]|jgi:LmbE family N-acetylglucosaminyl deacetylase|nr:PIG-L family deacetylase [Rhizomicrobium sp.]
MGGLGIRRIHAALDQIVHDRLYSGRAMVGGPDRNGFSIDDLPDASALCVVAHPDDEIIGAGYMLTRLPTATIVLVTDGAPRDGGATARAAGFAGNGDYRKSREKEAAAALALTGNPSLSLIHFAVPDQQAIFNATRLTLRLADIMRRGKFRYVITHPYEGGHPDHDAAALAVHAACLLLRDEAAPVVVEMTSYHLLNGEMAYGQFLPHDKAGVVKTFLLDPREQALKRRMLACHQSQNKILENFPVDAERFRAAPPYDFLDAPHPGRLAYETFLWKIDGAAWRRAATRVLNRLGLLSRR